MMPLAALLCLFAVLVPRAAQGAENDFKVVDGVLVRPLSLPGDEVAELSGDDRVVYYIDLRTLAQDPVRLEAQTPITVVGYEGPRPDQISAHLVKVRDATQAPAAPRRPHGPADLRVIEGRVQASERRAITLLTSDGQTVTVRLSDLVAMPRYVFLVGERLRVLGVLGDDQTLIANALVQQASPVPAAVRPGAERPGAGGGYGP